MTGQDSKSSTNYEKTYKIERSLDHAYSLLQSLNRDRKKGVLCDVTIVVGTKTYLVHRYVLAASSDYFRDLLDEDEKFSEVKIEDAAPETVEQCIEYIYTGTVDVTNDNILPLWDLCVRLQLTKIAAKCADYLVTSMNAKQCLVARKLAFKHGHEELKDAANTFGRENLHDISLESEFLELNKEELRFFLDSPETVKHSPTTLYHAVVNWIHHVYEPRSVEFSSLLVYIKMSSFSSQFLLETVRKEPLFRICNESRSLLEQELFSRISITEVLPTIVLIDSSACAIKAYNIATRKICKMRALEKEMHENCTMICLNDFIYVLKGVKVFSLDCRNRIAIWTRVSDLRQKHVSKIEAGIHNDCLYVIGGKVEHDGAESGTEVSAFGEYHHPSRNQWLAMRNMPTKRYGHVVEGCGDVLYCIGGCGEQGAILDTVDRFNPRACAWEPGSSPMNKPRVHASAVSHGGRVYVLGGETHPGEVTDCVEYYVPHANTWTIISRMASPRSDFSTAILGDKLYAVGGATEQDGSKVEASVEVMNIETNTWEIHGNIKGIGKLASAVLKELGH